MTAAPGSTEIRVGGPVRRVAIVTIRHEPAALYLASRLASAGVQLTLVSQTRMRVETDSWAYFKRFRQRYGAKLALDYLLLFLVREGVRMPRRLAGKASVPETGGTEVLRRDRSPADIPGLRTLELDDINRGPGLAAFEEVQPDLVLLAGAPVLGKKAIAVAKVACINPHCGITPAYSGGSPFDWAIYERRFDDVGYTIHLVVPTVDAGAVLVQERVAWDKRQPNRHLWPILAQGMYDRLAQLARELIDGKTLVARPQGQARVLPPAGLCARFLAERRRKAAREHAISRSLP